MLRSKWRMSSTHRHVYLSSAPDEPRLKSETTARPPPRQASQQRASRPTRASLSQAHPKASSSSLTPTPVSWLTSKKSSAPLQGQGARIRFGRPIPRRQLQRSRSPRPLRLHLAILQPITNPPPPHPGHDPTHRLEQHRLLPLVRLHLRRRRSQKLPTTSTSGTAPRPPSARSSKVPRTGASASTGTPRGRCWRASVIRVRSMCGLRRPRRSGLRTRQGLRSWRRPGVRGEGGRV